MPPPGQIPKSAKIRPPPNAPEDAKDDVRQNAEASALHNLTSEPTRYQPDHDPRDKTRGQPPDGHLRTGNYLDLPCMAKAQRLEK